jgi:CRISPR-associated protein Csx10
MIGLEYRLQLLEPLLVPGLLGEPNSAISYPFVPGSQIRGALIGLHLRSKLGSGEIDLLDEEGFRKLFFSGNIRYLNAYPEDSREKRMLPTPRSWFTVKREESEILDRSNKQPQNGDSCDPKQKLEEVSAEFCSLSPSGEVELLSPMRQINVHTQRDPMMGRATRDKGAVFRYNALAPGQCFVGVILFDTADSSSSDLQVIKELLQRGDLWLGGSRSAGYGHVCIDRVRVVEDWQEIEDLQAYHDVPAEEKFTVTLLSDALVRDPYTGQFSKDPTPEIAAVLGTGSEDLCIEICFWSTSLVGGFNRKWGLPLPQAVALAAGSVFVFETKKEIDKEKLQRLVEQGIGERRIEGFGRITVDWHKKPEYPHPNPREERDTQGTRTPDPTSQPVTLTGESKDIAEKMIQHMFRARLDRWLAVEINRTTINNQPSNSQLSQLRLVARDAMRQGCLFSVEWSEFSDALESVSITPSSVPDPLSKKFSGHGISLSDAARITRPRDNEWRITNAGKIYAIRKKGETLNIYQQGASLQPIKEHLDSALKRKTAREQFEGAYVSGQRLDRWIYDLLRELHPPEIGGVTLEQSKLEELAREYTIRLLDGVLHKATRSSRARAGSEGAE